MVVTGLLLPLTARPKPGTFGNRTYEIVDSIGRHVATVQSSTVDSVAHAAFDAETVARLFVAAGNCVCEVPA